MIYIIHILITIILSFIGGAEPQAIEVEVAPATVELEVSSQVIRTAPPRMQVPGGYRSVNVTDLRPTGKCVDSVCVQMGYDR